VSQPVVRQLVLKDLYLNRSIVLGTIAAGAVSLAISPLGGVPFYVGSISYVTILVILNIFLVMSSVVQERKDKVLVFVLSLPVSTSQYTRAKIAGGLVMFGVPWALLTAASLAVIGASALPDGLMPLAAIVSAYLLLYYCALFAVALVSDSPAAIGAGIVAGNVSINFIIPLVTRLPSLAARTGPVAVWGVDVMAVLAAEAALAALALLVAFVLQSRRTDFV
jgi:hypothetical protein